MKNTDTYASTIRSTSVRVHSETAIEKSFVLREEIGEVLRMLRQRQGKTLREISSQARVSLGYISEVERGQKEASSELIAAICEAINVPLSSLLRLVSNRLVLAESKAPWGVRMRANDEAIDRLDRELARNDYTIPDTVPEEFLTSKR